MDTLLISTTHPHAIPHALEILTQGGLVAFPTDTVYGLAAHVRSAAGIDRLYEAKSRAANKAIAVLLAETEQLALLTTGLNPAAQRLAEAFWPGALTLVVAKHPDLPANLSPVPTLGVRMPDHAFARALMRVSGPLATTSANLSGAANPRTAQDVLEQLAGRVDLVLDGGPVADGLPSTVVDCTHDPVVILREGGLSPQRILDCLAQMLPAFTPAPLKPPINPDVLDQLDIRVGTIERVEDLPKSAKLLRLTVNFGDNTRIILAGMKNERADPQEIVGQQALFVVNLPPRKMAGEISEGMLFDIGFADGVTPVLAVPEKAVPNGTRAG